MIEMKQFDICQTQNKKRCLLIQSSFVSIHALSCPSKRLDDANDAKDAFSPKINSLNEYIKHLIQLKIHYFYNAHFNYSNLA